MDNITLITINIISLIIMLTVIIILYIKFHKNITLIVSDINQINMKEYAYNKKQDAIITSLTAELTNLQNLLSPPSPSSPSSSPAPKSPSPSPTSPSPILTSSPVPTLPSSSPAPASSTPIFLSTPAPISITSQESIKPILVAAPTTSSPVNCSVSAWQNSGTCSVTCGEGTLQETRTIINQPINGGASCPLLTRNIPCNNQTCPVNCVVGPWSNQGSCSTPCGPGNQQQVRSIITPASNGGTPCPTTTQNITCNSQSCPPSPVIYSLNGYTKEQFVSVPLNTSITFTFAVSNSTDAGPLTWSTNSALSPAGQVDTQTSGGFTVYIPPYNGSIGANLYIYAKSKISGISDSFLLQMHVGR
jgi:hypothetical protein